MHITETIEMKIERLKNNPETLYAGIDFENQYQAKLKELEILNKEMDQTASKK